MDYTTKIDLQKNVYPLILDSFMDPFPLEAPLWEACDPCWNWESRDRHVLGPATATRKRENFLTDGTPAVQLRMSLRERILWRPSKQMHPIMTVKQAPILSKRRQLQNRPRDLNPRSIFLSTINNLYYVAYVNKKLIIKFYYSFITAHW